MVEYENENEYIAIGEKVHAFVYCDGTAFLQSLVTLCLNAKSGHCTYPVMVFDSREVMTMFRDTLTQACGLGKVVSLARPDDADPEETRDARTWDGKPVFCYAGDIRSEDIRLTQLSYNRPDRKLYGVLGSGEFTTTRFMDAMKVMYDPCEVHVKAEGQWFKAPEVPEVPEVPEMSDSGDPGGVMAIFEELRRSVLRESKLVDEQSPLNGVTLALRNRYDVARIGADTPVYAK